MSGYGLAQVRAGPFCEDIEAPDGGLEMERSIAVDEVWGGIDPAFEIDGRIQAFWVRDGGGVRVGRDRFWMIPGLAGSGDPCRYP